MKLALDQAKKIAIAALLGIAAMAPTTAYADVYFHKDASGVFRFTRTPVPGAKRFRGEIENGGSPATRNDGAYDHIIVDTAARYGVDAALVKAIIHAESTFQPKARSRAGARGLMQLMPRTAVAYGVTSRDLDEPRPNIHAGVRHLRSLLQAFSGDVRLAVAAYNAGAGAVRRHRGLPPFPETRDYVRKVLRLRARYGKMTSVRS